ncbi:hypothetical protein DPMN_142005 [Dreissena polymorpha]|uniref:Uncharacterized protein n=1 Tax=Dreissena polymorpha TaxID=45954 RepID=A0A9D4JKF6_DREPO|nr:hypothetical protein DPMN_142005 [Dreissena polymorpha]
MNCNGNRTLIVMTLTCDDRVHDEHASLSHHGLTVILNWSRWNEYLAFVMTSHQMKHDCSGNVCELTVCFRIYFPSHCRRLPLIPYQVTDEALNGQISWIYHLWSAFPGVCVLTVCHYCLFLSHYHSRLEKPSCLTDDASNDQKSWNDSPFAAFPLAT